MVFRYRVRVLLVHDNQPWVSKILPLLDLPIFHLTSTDNDVEIRKQIQEGNIDIVITGINTECLLHNKAEDGSLSFKQASLWQNLENRYPVILLCTQQEMVVASDLVQKGRVANYFIVDPVLDKNRLFVIVLKTFETSLLKKIVHSKFPETSINSRHILESIETMRMLSENMTPLPQSYVAYEEIPPPPVVVQIDNQEEMPPPPVVVQIDNQQEIPPPPVVIQLNNVNSQTAVSQPVNLKGSDSKIVDKPPPPPVVQAIDTSPPVFESPLPTTANTSNVSQPIAQNAGEDSELLDKLALLNKLKSKNTSSTEEEDSAFPTFPTSFQKN